MFASIGDDIKRTFEYGNMVNRLVIINIGVYMIFALIQAFVPTFYVNFVSYFQLPGQFSELIIKPWTLISYMFLHESLGHLVWNMISLYVFGNIMGDLLGDNRILPTYIIGGLVGAFLYIIAFNFTNGFFPNLGLYAEGASAGVLAIVFAAVATSPDYLIHLMFIGPVRIKFIGLLILFFDVIGMKALVNSGGHVMHLGGTAYGLLVVYLLRSSIDFGAFFKREKKKPIVTQVVRTRSPLTVAHRSGPSKSTNQHQPILDENDVDKILEKIKKSGYDSLTDSEKETLYNASKN
jgi:membrane associated rhomboid family serine protease